MPIVSLPGRGYSLVDGYFLPLLLSTREATALVLGARLLAGQTSAEIASAADEAVAKLLAVIGDDARRGLRELDEVLDLATSPDLRARLDVGDERVRALWQAILERRVTTIRYFGRNRSQETVRQVEPMRLGYANGAWYTTAYCRDRQRRGALQRDRIEHLEVEADRFRGRPAAAGRSLQRSRWSFAFAARSADGCGNGNIGRSSLRRRSTTSFWLSTVPATWMRSRRGFSAGARRLR